MLLFLVFYLSLAYFTKGLFRIQFHSIVHCINAVLLASCFYYSSNISLVSLNIIKQMNMIYNDFAFICAANSNGYFIADFIDILLDNKNTKRRIYIFHHITAIIGISTIYLGDNKCILAIWCLEIGGIIHHLKNMSEVYSFNYYCHISILTIYFVIYPLSRLYFILNVFTGLYYNLTLINFINASVSTLLFIQNIIWLIKNFKKLIM